MEFKLIHPKFLLENSYSEQYKMDSLNCLIFFSDLLCSDNKEKKKLRNQSIEGIFFFLPVLLSAELYEQNKWNRKKNVLKERPSTSPHLSSGWNIYTEGGSILYKECPRAWESLYIKLMGNLDIISAMPLFIQFCITIEYLLCLMF